MSDNQATRKKWEDIPKEETWDLTDLFECREEWKKELKAVQDDVSNVTKFQGKLKDSGKTLLNCLEARKIAAAADFGDDLCQFTTSYR